MTNVELNLFLPLVLKEEKRVTNSLFSHEDPLSFTASIRDWGIVVELIGLYIIKLT